MNYRRLQPAEVRDALSWIGENHYLGDVAGCIFALEFLESRERIGAMRHGPGEAHSLATDLPMDSGPARAD